MRKIEEKMEKTRGTENYRKSKIRTKKNKKTTEKTGKQNKERKEKIQNRKKR